MELQDGDVVVQRLRVVVVVDVRRGHPQGLGSGAAELLGEVVVTDSHVDGVTGADNAGRKVANDLNLTEKRGQIELAQSCGTHRH